MRKALPEQAAGFSFDAGFQMKAHSCVDDASGLVHQVECLAANVPDVTQVHKPL